MTYSASSFNLHLLTLALPMAVNFGNTAGKTSYVEAAQQIIDLILSFPDMAEQNGLINGVIGEIREKRHIAMKELQSKLELTHIHTQALPSPVVEDAPGVGIDYRPDHAHLRNKYP